MTSVPPDDVIHFRGKTLTPESPRPLHIPEPSNIPVLENQMDPIFNDTSTYDITLHAKDTTSSLPRAGDTAHLMEQYARIYSLLADKNQTMENGGGRDQGSANIRDFDQAEVQEIKHGSNVSDPQSSHSACHFKSTLVPMSAQEHCTTSSKDYANCPTVAIAFKTEVDSSINQNNPPNTAPQGSQSQSNSQTMPHDPDSGINYESLLDNLCQPTAPAPSPSEASALQSIPATGTNTRSLDTEPSLSSPYTLPPRPPPQEKPYIHPNYSPTDDIRSFHNIHAQKSTTSPHVAQSNFYEAAAVPLGTPGEIPQSSLQSGLYPPVSSFQQTHITTPQVDNEASRSVSGNDRSESSDALASKPQESRNDEAPWGPEIQRKYDDFLHNERTYVTEGVWDRFASGSRLFVGNLPSERVTKRDLFHLFHKYGQLAQISIKPAYGFVQFMDAASCRRALDAEQGGSIRGRKIHLEISKPQRNTRSTVENSRQRGKRRSRSPDRAKGRESRRGNRGDRISSGRKSSFDENKDRVDGRHGDTYRPTKSPPQASRRDEYRSRDRSIDKKDPRGRRRSRSPYRSSDRYRSPTPRAQGYDSDSELPIPRRAPRHVPDVQIIVLENIANEFVYRVETCFRDHNLRTDVLILSPRIRLPPVIRRQILEGVLAIVKLSKSNQYAGKIPLQVFDRSSGVNNVRFNEYSGLEPKVAAEVILQARNVPISAPSPAIPPHGLGIQAPLPPQNMAPQPNIANLISNLDAPTLQSLLGALQPNPIGIAQNYASPNPQSADLAHLLNTISHQTSTVSSIIPSSQNFAPLSTIGQFPNNTGVETETNLATLLSRGQPQANPSQVQNIIDQLTQWKK
ncbi:nuclear polyadenylated RNA-binding protein 3 [Ophidiomyces ophidiicola]|nr:nuclear polyadenylated RNA-binding protein 3 [Ophidiomyces ophidiicola]